MIRQLAELKQACFVKDQKVAEQNHDINVLRAANLGFVKDITALRRELAVTTMWAKDMEAQWEARCNELDTMRAERQQTRATPPAPTMTATQFNVISISDDHINEARTTSLTKTRPCRTTMTTTACKSLSRP